MIVVSDTSPVLNLSIAGHLHLLQQLFGEVVLPPSVVTELQQQGINLEAAWMRVVRATDLTHLSGLLQRLDPGEAEAIAIAVEIKADLILIHEHRGRRIAAENGLEFVGLLGVLTEAKGRHLIAECKRVLDDMIARAGFWIGDELRSRFLIGLGEEP